MDWRAPMGIDIEMYLCSKMSVRPYWNRPTNAVLNTE